MSIEFKPEGNDIDSDGVSYEYGVYSEHGTRIGGIYRYPILGYTSIHLHYEQRLVDTVDMDVLKVVVSAMTAGEQS